MAGGAAFKMEDVLVSRQTIGRELLLVADALQLYLGDRIQELRDRNLFVGVAFQSGESPPGSKRFTGLRFPVTWVCMPVIPPVREWENGRYDKTPPVDVENYMMDILHCPGKDCYLQPS